MWKSNIALAKSINFFLITFSLCPWRNIRHILSKVSLILETTFQDSNFIFPREFTFSRYLMKFFSFEKRKRLTVFLHNTSYIYIYLIFDLDAIISSFVDTVLLSHPFYKNIHTIRSLSRRSKNGHKTSERHFSVHRSFGRL